MDWSCPLFGSRTEKKKFAAIASISWYVTTKPNKAACTQNTRPIKRVSKSDPIECSRRTREGAPYARARSEKMPLKWLQGSDASRLSSSPWGKERGREEKRRLTVPWLRSSPAPRNDGHRIEEVVGHHNEVCLAIDLRSKDEAGLMTVSSRAVRPNARDGERQHLTRIFSSGLSFLNPDSNQTT
jgi:hypothetical protein